MFEVFGRTGPPTYFTGPPFWTLKFISSLIAMLTKEPDMLQPDAFCEHTMQQNATAAGAPPGTPLGELTSLPTPPRWFQGGRYAARRETGNGVEGKGKTGEGRERRGG